MDGATRDSNLYVTMPHGLLRATRPRVCALFAWIATLLLATACKVGTFVPGTPQDGTVASVGISVPVALLTAVGEQLQLTAIARDGAANVLSGLATQWTSSDTAVVSVSAGGLVSAVAAGSEDDPVTVTASISGVTGTVPVYVLPPEYVAEDVNDDGRVAGFERTHELESDGSLRSRHSALTWAATGAVTEIGTLGGDDATASAVNASGTVVGTSQFTTGEEHGFVWSALGGISDLGTLGGSASSAADINDGGEIVGTAQNVAQEVRVVIWGAAGGASDLQDLAGGGYVPAALNAAGDVAGTLTLPGGEERAFYWTSAGGVTDLGTLGGTGSFAADLNDAGAVVGRTYLPPDTTDLRGFYWSVSTAMIVVGTLSGGETAATAVNASGLVVGYSQTASGPHAFSWSAQGATVMMDLGTLGGCCSWAYGVNDLGHVVGTSTVDSGERRAFIWTSSSGKMIELGSLAAR